MKFEIGVVLTITHDKLLADMREIYKILNFMLDDTLQTFQIPRATRFCKPFLMQQHPELEQWDTISPYVDSTNYLEYWNKARELFGETIEVQKAPSGVWTHKEPEEEAEQFFSKDRMLIVKMDKPGTDPRRN